MIQVLVIDDHPSVRAGVRRALDADPEIEVVGEGANAEDARRLVETTQPHVVVLDIELPDASGATVARHLQGTAVRVLAFSAHAGRGFVRAMLDAGAAGYLTKDSSDAELVAAVKAVARGEGRWHVVPNDLTDPVGALTEREQDVIGLLARGLSNADIAATLFLSDGTVRNVLTALYAKIGVENSREAIAWAWKNGFGHNAP